MHKTRGWALLFVLNSALAFSQSQTDTVPRVPGPQESDPLFRPNSTARTASKSIPRGSIRLEVSAPPANALARADGAVVGAINISPGLLTRPVQHASPLGEAFIGLGLPAEMARIDFDIEGAPYQLVFDEELTEPQSTLRHVRMSVINVPNASARFSIDMATGELYGSLQTPDVTYLFESTADRRGQLIFRAAGGDTSLVGSGQRSSIVHATALARRHHQLRALERLEPEQSWSTLTRAHVIGGKLGSVTDGSAQAFVQLATRLAAITQLTGEETFESRPGRPLQGGGTLFRFRQRVEGIPVDSVNEMAVDRDGRVRQLTTSIVPSGTASAKVLLSAADALKAAQIEWQASYQKSGVKLQALTDIELLYRQSSSLLQPWYVFRFRGPDEPEIFLARVDATTGHAQIQSLLFNVDYVSCKDVSVPPPGLPNPPPPPITCGARTQLGFANPARTGYCTSPTASGNCSEVITKNPYEVIAEIDSIVPAAIATNAPGSTPACCSQMNVSIVQNTKFPYPSSWTTGPNILLLPVDSTSAEVMAHELGHAYVNTYNDALEVDGNLFAASVREGTAYLFAELIGAISGRTSRYGNQWVFGDGDYYAANVPDMCAEPTSGPGCTSAANFQYWQDIQAGVDSHYGGQVIFRFFKRLQDLSGISNQRLLGVVVGTMAGIRDFDGNGIDAGDLRRAVRATISDSETTLKNAVATAYNDLYTSAAAGPIGPPLPPGDPGPVGAPPYPASMSAAYAGCGTYNGLYLTVYQTYWSATPDTTTYVGWIKADADPAFRYDTHVDASVTSLPLFTNQHAEARMSSCNASGCSGLSLSNVVVSHLCGN